MRPVGAADYFPQASFAGLAHHVRPFAKGGESTVSNLTLLCSRHNRFLADQDYGAEHMARVVADSRATRADSSVPILAPHKTSNAAPLTLLRHLDGSAETWIISIT
jgi:hypothetical protein